MGGERVQVHRAQESSSRMARSQSDQLADQDTERQQQQVRDRADKLGEEILELMDEIDTVLEENALEFVNEFVQQGGE